MSDIRIVRHNVILSNTTSDSLRAYRLRFDFDFDFASSPSEQHERGGQGELTHGTHSVCVQFGSHIHTDTVVCQTIRVCFYSGDSSEI